MTSDDRRTRVFTTSVGDIEAVVDGDIVRAAGVPYAHADRFEKPRALSHLGSDPFPAFEASPACPQVPTEALEVIGDQTGGLPQSEHCQRLTVTLPADHGAADEPLPVMVWIHGGSYVSGAGDLPLYDPRSLVLQERVIVVTVTYRLGVLGYVGDGVERPANLGLLDQLAAFRWVQANIAAFGGDPARVTAFGQSAGADAVLHLMATDGAASLFSRAIVQSAPLRTIRGRAGIGAAMNAALDETLVDGGDLDLAVAQAAVARAAQKSPVALMAFGPQAGQDPLPNENAMRERWADVAPGIPLLIGTTAHEARLFLPLVPALNRVSRVPLLGPLAVALVDRALTTWVYSGPARAFARAYERAGGEVVRFTFRWRAPRNAFGSSHAIEVPFVFGSEDVASGLAPYAGATASDLDRTGVLVRTAWGHFAHGRTDALGSARGVIAFRRTARP
ncbi:carboxylesterase family protein [Microbacterium sp. che218]|uniref:carboxylesterase family protein n=1 Tax=Microbacterium sp. che218 TaxID=3140649 RepID=UPI0033681B6E